MILDIRVVPKSSRNLVKEENGRIKVYLTKPAEDGLANQQLVELLAEYFKVPQHSVRVVSGLGSKNKVIEILI